MVVFTEVDWIEKCTAEAVFTGLVFMEMCGVVRNHNRIIMGLRTDIENKHPYYKSYSY